MGFPEFVVTDNDLKCKSGGKRLGRLSLVWAQITAVGEYWRPNDITKWSLRWRGLAIKASSFKGLKFIELVAGYHRVAIVWFDHAAVYAAHPHFADIDKVQQYYDKFHNYRPDWCAEPNFGGLGVNEAVQRTRPLDDSRDDGLVNRP